MRKRATPAGAGSSEQQPASVKGRRMFSAASFYDVIHAPSSASDVVEPEARRESTVVSFYGFRGGAGRTMALAHVAASLADARQPVVAVDLDLEAPGLHAVLGAPNVAEGFGSLRLLRQILVEGSQEIALAPHVSRVDLPDGGHVLVIPAGPLDDRYLASLEELAVGAWHTRETEESPVAELVAAISRELGARLILLDCRTGLSDLSASALFHASDMVVCFVPLSEQALDGLDVFLRAAAAAKAKRSGRPDILLVPAMVPPGSDGRKRLEEYVFRFEERYAERILGTGDVAAESIPILRTGVEYHAGIALGGKVDATTWLRAREIYRSLVDEVRTMAGLDQSDQPPPTESIPVEQILNEVRVPRELAFADELDMEQIDQLFVKPTDFDAVLERSTTFVVGAKGAGKTMLWRHLVKEGSSPQARGSNEAMRFVAGHEPHEGDARDPSRYLSEIGFREVTRDARLAQREAFTVFWQAYAVARLARWDPTLERACLATARNEAKKRMRDMFDADDAPAFRAALAALLREPSIGSVLEAALRAADRQLMEDDRHVTLVYDGLDTSFERNTERQKGFVDGLVRFAYGQRSVLRRLFFKVFLREDIYADVDVPNRSHLDAAKLELRWTPADLWRMSLKLLWGSEAYRDLIKQRRPGSHPPWDREGEEDLLALLIPLWGDKLEAGNKVSTGSYILNRTADGKGRYFPRTLVQLLGVALDDERTQKDHRADRVLRSASLQHAFDAASKQRFTDLSKEYVELGPYLAALKGMNPTATREELRAHLNRNIPKGKKRPTLHRGTKGWARVLDLLVEIGVLGEYRRARGERGEPKYQVSLLYRPAIGVKMTGLV